MNDEKALLHSIAARVYYELSDSQRNTLQMMTLICMQEDTREFTPEIVCPTPDDKKRLAYTKRSLTALTRCGAVVETEPGKFWLTPEGQTLCTAGISNSQIDWEEKSREDAS